MRRRQTGSTAAADIGHRIALQALNKKAEKYSAILSYSCAAYYYEKAYLLTQGEHEFSTYLRSLFLCEKYSLIIELCKNSPKSTPGDDLILARALEKLGEWEKCIKHIESLGDIKGVIASALAYICGKAYRALGNVDRALKLFEFGLEEDPNNQDLITIMYTETLFEPRRLNELSAMTKENLNSSEKSRITFFCAILKCDGLAGSETKAPDINPLTYGIGEPILDLVILANLYYRTCRYREAHALSKKVLDKDAHCTQVLSVYISCLAELNLLAELFELSHQLTKKSPQLSQSWFAAALYYHKIDRFENARRLFKKAVTMEPTFFLAWIYYGHTLSADDQSDQALVAYRTANRHCPGSHIPWLSMGQEYIKIETPGLGTQCLNVGLELCEHDVDLFIEMGCVHALHDRVDGYLSSVFYFKKALAYSKNATVLKIVKNLPSQIQHKLEKKPEIAAFFHPKTYMFGLTEHKEFVLIMNLGFALLNLGCFKNAEECFMFALDSRLEKSAIKLQLATALAAQGKPHVREIHGSVSASRNQTNFPILEKSILKEMINKSRARSTMNVDPLFWIQ